MKVLREKKINPTFNLFFLEVYKMSLAFSIAYEYIKI